MPAPTDTERLDWLERFSPRANSSVSRKQYWLIWFEGTGEWIARGTNWRDAVDTAMRGEGVPF